MALNQVCFLTPGKELKRPTASPDGVMTNENMLREYMASLEAKEHAKKDLNNTSTIGNPVPINILA